MNYILAFFIPLLFISCSNNPTKSIATQDEPFTISRSIAKALSAPVPINAKILLQVSTDLNKSSVDDASIYIKNSSGALVDSIVTYQQKVISITPKVYLQPNTDYTIYATTAIASLQGEHLSKNSLISFTSAGALSDTTPPHYLGTNIGSVHHPKEIYYFQFDEPISPLSITDDMFVITDPEHNISVKARVSGDLLIFTPQEALQPGFIYNITLTLDSRIQDLSGNAMTAQSPINLSLYETIYEPYPTIIRPLSSNTYEINDEIYCLEGSNNLLFVGGNNGLTILDFDLASTSFSLLSSLSNIQVGTVYRVRTGADSKRLYVGSSNGFYIIDITTLTTPTIISHYTTSSPVYNLDIQDKRAYLAATLDGLIGLNITDENDVVLNFIQNQASVVYDVLLVDAHLYTSDYNRTIRAYTLDGNITDTTTAPIGAHLRNLAYGIDSKHLLIASGVQGINTITNLNSTLTIGSKYRLPSYTSNIYIFNNFGYTNLPGIGIYTFQAIDYEPNFNQLLVPDPYIDIQAFTYVQDSTAEHKYLIVANDLGTLYTMKLQ